MVLASFHQGYQLIFFVVSFSGFGIKVIPKSYKKALGSVTCPKAPFNYPYFYFLIATLFGYFFHLVSNLPIWSSVFPNLLIPSSYATVHFQLNLVHGFCILFHAYEVPTKSCLKF